MNSARGEVARRHPISLVDVAAFLSVFGLTLGLVLLTLSGRGALGEGEGGVGIGRTLAVTELLIMCYLLLNSKCIPYNAGVSVVIGWIVWVCSSVTLSDLSRVGSPAWVFDIVRVLYCPLYFLFYCVLVRRDNRWFRAAQVSFCVLVVINAGLFYGVYTYQNLNAQSGFALLNDVYFVLLILPWIAVSPSKVARYSLFILVTFVVLWSMKRTALAALVGSVAAYYLCDRLISRKVVDWRWAIGVCVICVLGFSVFRYVDRETRGNLRERFANAVDDRGSGRLDIYVEVAQRQGNASAVGWLLGHGHDAVSGRGASQGGLSAHNDWQEVLYDYGLPGLVLYVWLHVVLVVQCARSIRQRRAIAPAFVAGYCIMLSMSLVSHLVLYPSYFSYLIAFFGAVFGCGGEPQNPRCYFVIVEDVP